MEKKSLIALEIILLIFAAGAAYAGITKADWPMPYHDAMHTSFIKTTSNNNISEIVLLKVFSAQGQVLTPVTADINGDEKAEVFLSAGSSVYALDSGFQVLWVKNLSCKPTAPGIYDLFADGKLEILYGCSDGGIYVLDKEGGLLWSYQTGGSIEYSPTAANLDYGKTLEVIAPSKDKNIYVFDANGTKVRDYYIPDSGFTMAAVGDIDSDKKNEIIVGSLDNKAYVISYLRGDVMVFDTQGSVSAPVIVKINRTNTYRIGLGTGDGHAYSIYYSTYNAGSRRKCNVTNCTYEPIKISKMATSWDFSGGEGAVAQPAVADLGGDKESEYVIGTTDKTLYILSTSGSILKKHSVNGKITSAPSITDLNGDKKAEIVYGASDGMVQILNSNGSRIWDYHSEDPVTESIALADLDRNGRLEILIPSGNRLYLFGDNSTEPERLEVNVSLNTTESTVTTTSTTTTSIIVNETNETLSSTTTTIPVLNDTTTTALFITTTTVPQTYNATSSNSSETMTEASFFGQPLSTVIVIFLSVFFLIQLFIVLVIYLAPRIIHRKIERVRTEIQSYKSDLKSLEKVR
jgi:hypothetical protein